MVTIFTLAIYLIITTSIDAILMGGLHISISRKSMMNEYVIEKENRIDLQRNYECSAYSSAYVLRHFGIEADGNEIYQSINHKMKNGYVYPRGIQHLLAQYQVNVKYCTGNLTSLKNEVAKGNPVIVMMKTHQDKNWLHYVPVVGYDERYIFISESLQELVNCNERFYNRRVENSEFKKLWNTSLLKMPFYRNTYMGCSHKTSISSC